MKKLTDTYRLNNGVGIPCIGFGTYLIPEGSESVYAVEEALTAGYRHIDAAATYGNEKSVGKALLKSGIARHELFVTSKLWNADRGYDNTLRAFDNTLRDLGLEYLDLYLIHWPVGKGTQEEKDRIHIDTWRAFEKLYEEGRVRALGVSNFLVHHLQPLLASAKIPPAVNQIEYHPGQMQNATVEYCQANNILVEAWGPLGSGKMLGNKTLCEIAARYDKSTAQLCIRWCLQHKVLPLPKSVTVQRMRQNADVFDFSISTDDMTTIDEMEYFGGSELDPDNIDF